MMSSNLLICLFKHKVCAKEILIISLQPATNGKVVQIILQSCSFVFRGKDVGKDGLNTNLRQLHFYVDRKEHARKRILFSLSLGDLGRTCQHHSGV